MADFENKRPDGAQKGGGSQSLPAFESKGNPNAGATPARRIRKAYLEITNRCNLSCSFCHGHHRPAHDLTKEEFEMLTDRLAGIPYLYFHLMGEPLLHPLLPHFLRRAWEKGFRPMLTTNGTLLAARGAALLQAPPFKASVSLHAPAANPAFAAPGYLPEVLAFAEKAAAAGTIVALRLWNRGGDETGNPKILAALEAAFPPPWREIRTGYCLSPRIFLEWGEAFDWPDLQAPERPADAPVFCHGLRDQVGVLADGRVVPCCLDAEGHAALGNLFEASLSDILASPAALTLYNGFTLRRAVLPLCRRCGFAGGKSDKRKGGFSG